MESAEVYSLDYVRFVLALAPFVVVLAWSLDPVAWPPKSLRLAIAAAVLFALSVTLPACRVWGLLPWLLLSAWAAVAHLKRFRLEEDRGTAALARLASSLYLPVGGVWALFAQLGVQPMGFSPVIVLLTGVHFHYAGFALPRLTGLWLRETRPAWIFNLAGWGVILGVPLVAVGITTTQLAMPAWIEIVSVSILAFSAFVVSIGQMRWALKSAIPAASRVFFAAGAAALSCGMVLAWLYGWRTVLPLSWVQIPFMYAVHGTLNSLGFCLPGFLGWKLLVRSGGVS